MLARLSSETDLAGFRSEARVLIAQGVRPENVQWQATGAVNSDLFAEIDQVLIAQSTAPPATVPASFLRLCQAAILHSDPQRFALLYRLLWRLVHEPALRHDPIDADMLAAQEMAQSVRRDMHKMKAFVRFRQVDREGQDQPVHVAWFEPDHHITEAVAPWFARRFTQMHWAILTPERCVQWDGKQLQFNPGADRSAAPPADAGEQLWLTYYQNIFNPARLKMKMMQKEMPRKYWHNLPEAKLIAPLAAGAQVHSEDMVDKPATTPHRRIAVTAAPAPSIRQDGIHSLSDLKDATMRCRECPIGQDATQSVTGQGKLRAKLMFVGEQPGDQEDLRGQPFVGPAGQLLDRALEQAGIPRDEAFVTNAVRHFKFELRGKRRIHKTPTQREAAACLHWLEDEIGLVNPGGLIALGATAARSLMGYAVPVTKERGNWLTRGDGRKVLVMLHPSALLRMADEEKQDAFKAFVADLGKARELL